MTTEQAQAQTPTPAPALKLPNFGFSITDNEVETQYLNGLVYGTFGVGKTLLMGTLCDIPEMNDVLFVDIEGGMRTIRDRSVSVIHARNYATIARTYEWLRAHCRFRDSDDTARLIQLAEAVGLRHTERRYRTVVFDSLTEAQKLYIYSITGIELGRMALDTVTINPEIQHWGRNDAAIRLLIRQARDLPMNVFFTAGEQVNEQTAPDGTTISFRLPDLPGKLARGIPHLLDLVAWYASDERKDEDGRTHTLRRLYVHPGRTYQAKNRSGQSEIRYLDDPTMADVIKLTN